MTTVASTYNIAILAALLSRSNMGQSLDMDKTLWLFGDRMPEETELSAVECMYVTCGDLIEDDLSEEVFEGEARMWYNELRDITLDKAQHFWGHIFDHYRAAEQKYLYEQAVKKLSSPASTSPKGWDMIEGGQPT